MKAVNIYSVTRVPDWRLMNEMKQQLSNRLYRLHNDNIEEVSFSVLAGAMKMQGEIETDDLDNLFSPSNFLISPITTPERFLNHEYFLTSHQQFIKREIMALDHDARKALFIGIKGRPGTGKSLLLYDIALEFAREYPTLMIHCGDLPYGLQRLNRALTRLHLYQLRDEARRRNRLLCPAA